MDHHRSRIVVIGTSASGKSTYARSVAAVLGITHVELDALHWGPDWTPKPPEEFTRLMEECASRPSWIIDGNYQIGNNPVWDRATTVIWLNYSFLTVFGRGLRRTLRRIITRETLWHGNRESFATTFASRDSILLWIITTYRMRRQQGRALRLSSRFSSLHWIEFRSPRAAEKYLHDLATDVRPGHPLDAGI